MTYKNISDTDPKKAALEETKEQEQQKLLSSHAKLTPDQQRWYDYNENIKAQKEEEKREQIQAQMARQQWEDSLKERQVEAQEAAAAAALIQAQNPSQIEHYTTTAATATAAIIIFSCALICD